MFGCFDGRLAIAAGKEDLRVMGRNQSSEYLPPRRKTAKKKRIVILIEGEIFLRSLAA